MEFTIPTTTEEMYETLNLIYKHYRTNVPIFREEELEIMVIPTLDNTFPTEEELLKESQKILAPAQTERRDKLKREIENRISEISNLLIHLEEEKTEKLEDLEQEYASKIIKTEKELTGRGLGTSLVGVDEINKIACEKTAMLGNLKMQYGIKKAELLSEKERLIESLEGVDSVYASLCENELVAKVTELKNSTDTTVTDWKTSVISDANKVYENKAVIEKFVIMPDHIHLLLCIEKLSGGTGNPSPTTGTV